ncbi:histidine phosphatase family protein [Kamptonema formosum]|uniref:histidine phosphatase family protein n=1 Tax=Kamptonema formosum TaxID=331992 RepID=UPI0003491439
MSLKLYLLRHGQTGCSRQNVFCGASDPELTPEGLEMAQAFAATYRPTPWSAIYSSPMGRTQATAQALCDAVGVQMELRNGLKEINYGQWEGLSAETVSRDYHDDYLRSLCRSGLVSAHRRRTRCGHCLSRFASH